MHRKEVAIGDNYGHWTILEFDGFEKSKNKNCQIKYWKCRCDCNNIFSVYDGDLKSGKSTKCKICSNDKMREMCQTHIVDLTNKEFGYWTVLEKSDHKKKYRKTFWKCRCKCKKEYIVQGTNLVSGKSTRCLDCAKKDSKGIPRKHNRVKISININDKYGKWTVIEDKPIDKKGAKKWLCKCDCGLIKEVGQSLLKKGTSTRCKECGYRDAGRKTFKDLTGQTFGDWFVIRRNGYANKIILWECKCKCDKIMNVRSSNLLSGNSKGCGRCHTHKEITGRFFSRIRVGAIKRNIEFNITVKYIWNLYIQQNRKCRYTNLDISFDSSYNSDTTASLDRIDSSKGYIEGNVQWVHKVVNVIKWSLSHQEFLSLCHLISNNNMEEKYDLDIEKLSNYFISKNIKK